MNQAVPEMPISLIRGGTLYWVQEKARLIHPDQWDLQKKTATGHCDRLAAPGAADSYAWRSRIIERSECTSDRLSRLCPRVHSHSSSLAGTNQHGESFP